MRDYYDDGWNDGYGRWRCDDGDYPTTDDERYSYRRGLKDGQKRRRIAEEIDRKPYREEDY